MPAVSCLQVRSKFESVAMRWRAVGAVRLTRLIHWFTSLAQQRLDLLADLDLDQHAVSLGRIFCAGLTMGEALLLCLHFTRTYYGISLLLESETTTCS